MEFLLCRVRKHGLNGSRLLELLTLSWLVHSCFLSAFFFFCFFSSFFFLNFFFFFFCLPSFFFFFCGLVVFDLPFFFLINLFVMVFLWGESATPIKPIRNRS